MLKPTRWSLSSKARMCTGRFGRLLFASEREATSTIPSLLQSGTIHCLYTIVLMKETTVETGTITDIWHLALVQQNQHASKETGQSNDKDVPDVNAWGQFWIQVKDTSEYFCQLPTNTKFPLKETGNKVLWRSVWMPDICPISTSTSSVAWNIKVLWRWILETQGKPTEKSAGNGAGDFQKYHKSSITGWLKLNKFPPSILF